MLAARRWAFVMLAVVGTVTVPERAFAPPAVAREGWVGTWSTPGPALASVLAADAVGTVAVGYEGDVRALDPGGNELWKARVGADVGNAPALLPGVVLVPSSDRISALDRSTGERRWERRMAASRVVAGTRSDGHDVAFVATRRGELLLLDVADGSTLRRAAIPGAVPSSAPYVWLSGAIGVVAWSTKGSCCRIGAVDLDRGVMRWAAKITNRSTVPVVHRGVVVVATSSSRPSRAYVTAYDAASGRVVWRSPVDGRFGTSLWGDAAGRDVVIASAEGSVLSLDVGDGTLRWTSTPVEPADEAHPKIAGDRVFLTPRSEGVVEIDRHSGTVVRSGRFTRDVYVHSSASAPQRFEVLVGNGFESAVWAFEPPAASESG